MRDNKSTSVFVLTTYYNKWQAYHMSNIILALSTAPKKQEARIVVKPCKKSAWSQEQCFGQ